jgi:hypothetical protein
VVDQWRRDLSPHLSLAVVRIADMSPDLSVELSSLVHGLNHSGERARAPAVVPGQIASTDAGPDASGRPTAMTPRRGVPRCAAARHA